MNTKKTLTLDGRDYEIVSEIPTAYNLRGARGAWYILIENKFESGLWILIPEGAPQRAARFTRNDDGSFERKR